MTATRRPTRRADDTPYDAGTLWTLRRHDRVARCTLIAHRKEWEVCVIVDGQPILSKRCALTTDVFASAEEWKGRLTAKGWTGLRPGSALEERVS